METAALLFGWFKHAIYEPNTSGFHFLIFHRIPMGLKRLLTITMPLCRLPWDWSILSIDGKDQVEPSWCTIRKLSWIKEHPASWTVKVPVIAKNITENWRKHLMSLLNLEGLLDENHAIVSAFVTPEYFGVRWQLRISCSPIDAQ